MQDANLNAGLIQATGNLMPPQDRLPPLAIHKGPQAGVEAPRQPRPTYELVEIGAGFQLGWEDVRWGSVVTEACVEKWDPTG